MLKLMTLLSFVTVLYGWDWSDDDYVVGVVGKWVKLDGCVSTREGHCTSASGCCSPLVCWMDGKCREKVPEFLSIEGFEYVTGKAGQYHRYDGCNNDRFRIGEYCNVTSDCCFPLDCISEVCHGGPTIASIAGALSSGFTLGRPTLI